MAMKTILFLCTGNYYRSRFAEIYFNDRARRQPLSWRANSLGIQRDFTGNGNVGPISANTLRYLEQWGIEATGESLERMPKRVEREDFDQYDLVIAVSRAEHEPMLAELWESALVGKVKFFDVEDVHLEAPETAIPRLKTHLDALINSLL